MDRIRTAPVRLRYDFCAVRQFIHASCFIAAFSATLVAAVSAGVDMAGGGRVLSERRRRRVARWDARSKLEVRFAFGSAD